jgi:hypothetical protein
VFLSETRQNKVFVEGLRWRLGLKHVVTFSGKGKGGGLALFWDESVQVELFKLGRNHIDVTICNLPEGNKWRCTFVYGEPRTHERHNMWSLLRRIKPLLPGPWVMLGDFNECMWQEEHWSRRRRSERQMSDFRETLSFCDLHDLGYKGRPWTYDNKQDGINNVRVRLDRVVACPDWTKIFPNYQVMHLTSSRSDHCPILFTLDCSTAMTSSIHQRRYEVYWEREASLGEEISCAWERHRKPNDLGDVANNLQGVMAYLHTWSKRTIGHIPRQIEKKRKKLEQTSMRTDSRNRALAKKLSRELDELLEKEELRWRQRSRVNWLRAGDRNTKYFHRKATWRAKKNKIDKLMDLEGNVIKDEPKMQEMATNFFKDLYTESDSVHSEVITNLLQEKVTTDINEGLCSRFTDEEISFALFQIGPTKAPGPDGFPACFYQRNWGTFKEDIIAAVRKFFEDGEMPEGVNETSIVLIPKVKNPIKLSDFRPISLCNVVYKIVAKCLVNRMRPLLQDIISETQSAFVPGRMITDNAIIAFECFHALQKGSKIAGNFCAYKLDLMKAYDRVDWNFLEEAMRKFGFAEQWIKWIMACVKTVRYSVRFNGKLLERFIPTRGLRQGDPLSPYLFLFVGESLSALLKHQINSNLIEELKICRKSPGISHLLFADDSLLFFRATPEQATCVNVVLRDYERGTGQLLSPAKCSIMLGQHCSEEDGAAVAAILNVGSMTMEDKYLGLPIPEGCIKEGKLKSSKEKLRKKCSDWNEKYMSGAAKETLIKSVAQAITTYAMSVFKFPAGLCDELSQIIRDFWWGDEEEKRKVHWMAWDKLTLPKSQGGIGFRDLRMFNHKPGY